jgi:hypothetical protein
MNPVRVIKQEPAARKRSRYYVFGVLFTLEREIEGVPVVTTVFTPALIRVRDRSKYTPHQGKQERYRRLVGGWAQHQREGFFYGAAANKRSAIEEVSGLGYQAEADFEPVV